MSFYYLYTFKWGYKNKKKYIHSCEDRQALSVCTDKNLLMVNSLGVPFEMKLLLK